MNEIVMKRTCDAPTTIRSVSSTVGESGPGRRIRETATIVLVSLTANTAALCAFGLARLIRPQMTFDVGNVIREGRGYLRHGLMEVIWWSVGLLALACAMAFVAAVPVRPICAMGRWFHVDRFAPSAAWFGRAKAKAIEPMSGWTYAVEKNAPANSYTWVGLELTDDTLVEGVLASHNPQVTEDTDRSLVLGAPLRSAE